MVLFDFFKSTKPIKVPEADQKAVDWFFTVDGKIAFQEALCNQQEMLDLWFSPNGHLHMVGCTCPKGNPYRREYPSTFFADYLRALKTIDMAFLATNAAHLAMDDDERDAIPYPDCLKAEYNPIINFAIKFKPIFYHKKGEELEYNTAMKSMIAYLHDCYVDHYIDESNEQWIYEESLWFDVKGKIRSGSEILADIKSKVKYQEIVSEFKK